MIPQQNPTEIKCTDCGKTATVPFKPTAGKPVYCRECLASIEPSRRTVEVEWKQKVKNQTMRSKLGLDEEKAGN